MATSSSDESNTTPVEFNFTTILGTSNGKSGVPSEKCPLCMRFRKTFYCRECIKNGDFTHSKAKFPDTERFAEKKLKLLQFQLEKSKHLKSFKDAYSQKIQVENLKQEINQCAERIRLLHLAIASSSMQITRGERSLLELKERAQAFQAVQLKFNEKLQKFLNGQELYHKAIAERKEKLEKVYSSLQVVVRKNILQLITHIFPITKVEPPESSEEPSPVEGPIIELEEAQQTTYVKGHWVFTGGSSSEVQYQIIESCLPGSGNYSAYPLWITDHKDSVPATLAEVGQRNPAYSIGAALTYTTQLSLVLAYFLDVQLPKKLCYSEFCGHELNEQQFLQKVAKLNANIIHLCLSQNVDPNMVQPRHSIPNLLLVLDSKTSDLGRWGSFEISPSLAVNMEESLLKDLCMIDESDDKDSDDETDLLTGEWETVTNLPNFEYTLTHARGSYSTSTVAHPQPRQRNPATSLAEGLVSSTVAAAVDAIWRVATGRK